MSQRWSALVPVNGLYVSSEDAAALLRCESWRGCRGGPFLKAQAALHAFGIDASTAADIRRYRVDGVRVWEYRDYGWFVHAYRHVPEQLVRVGTRSDGREVPIYSTAHYERVATSKKEVRRARRVLDRDPLSPA